MKLFSWNVNGLRAIVKKDFTSIFRQADADIYCLQETKAQDDQVRNALRTIDDYQLFSCSADKKGYSGVSVLSRATPLNVSCGIGVKKHDAEGRVLTLEYKKFILINVYVPNSGNGLRRLDYRALWDKSFASHLRRCKRLKPVIVAGDFNVAHQAIDLARPKQNYNKTSGYTQTEIDGMNRILKVGFKDTYRTLYPERIQYTFWSIRMRARERNVGWRIDYFLVDKRLYSHVQDSVIHDQIMGSDHCPITLDIDL